MTTNDDQTTGQLPSKISRRTLAAGAAWSVPVIAVASAAPAYALSGAKPTATFVGACKWPGNSCSAHKKSYSFVFDIKNNSDYPIYVCSPTVTVTSGDSVTWTHQPPASGCYGPIASGATVRVPFFFEYSGNSANLVFTADVKFSWGHNCPCSNDPINHPQVTVPISVVGTPPNGPFCVC